MTRHDEHVFPDLDWLPRPPVLERDPGLDALRARAPVARDDFPF